MTEENKNNAERMDAKLSLGHASEERTEKKESDENGEVREDAIGTEEAMEQEREEDELSGEEVVESGEEAMSYEDSDDDLMLDDTADDQLYDEAEKSGEEDVTEEEILRGLKDSDWHVRRDYLEKLSKRVSRDWIPILTELLEDTSSKVRRRAGEILASVTDQEAAEYLLSKYNSAGWLLQRAITDVLKQSSWTEKGKYLLDNLDSFSGGRDALIEIIASAPDPEITERLKEYLKEGNTAQKKAMLKGCRMRCDEDALELITTALDDPDPNIREMLAYCFESFDNETVWKHLHPYIAHEDPVRRTMVQNIVRSKLGDELSRYIDKTWNYINTQDRFAYLEFLSGNKDSLSKTIVFSELNSKFDTIRRKAAEVLHFTVDDELFTVIGRELSKCKDGDEVLATITYAISEDFEERLEQLFPVEEHSWSWMMNTFKDVGKEEIGQLIDGVGLPADHNSIRALKYLYKHAHEDFREKVTETLLNQDIGQIFNFLMETYSKGDGSLESLDKIESVDDDQLLEAVKNLDSEKLNEPFIKVLVRKSEDSPFIMRLLNHYDQNMEKVDSNILKFVTDLAPSSGVSYLKKQLKKFLKDDQPAWEIQYALEFCLTAREWAELCDPESKKPKFLPEDEELREKIADLNKELTTIKLSNKQNQEINVQTEKIKNEIRELREKRTKIQLNIKRINDYYTTKRRSSILGIGASIGIAVSMYFTWHGYPYSGYIGVIIFLIIASVHFRKLHRITFNPPRDTSDQLEVKKREADARISELSRKLDYLKKKSDEINKTKIPREVMNRLRTRRKAILRTALKQYKGGVFGDNSLT